MKKYFAILTLLLCLSSLQAANAYVTTEQTTDTSYLQNHGYSKELIRLVDLTKAQTNGKPFVYNRNEPEYYQNKYVKFFRQVYMYADPGVDDQKFMQHDIQYSVRLDDL